MIPNKKNLIQGISFLLFGLCCYNALAGGTQLQPWQNEFCLCLRQLVDGNTKIATAKALDGALEGQALSIESEIAIPAIFELWFRNQQSIELLWWKQENRATRCFVMALYLCATDEPVSWIPNFARYITRFNQKEQEERQEEQKFILTYRSSIAGLIAQALEKRDSMKYNSEFKNFFGNVAESKIGSDLPVECSEEYIEK
ncbi:MAG: hypothetical protein JW896_12985 [Deltaproteobacteria bacterium]|nr:hypothetical protein [Deltaproteobacteria bacterium]